MSPVAGRLGFGMLITNVEGLGLGGAQTFNSKRFRTAAVSAGTTAHVQFEFTCSVLPGAYVVSAGVWGIVDSTQIIMHRINDALMFRVAPEEDLLSGDFT